MSLNWKEIDAVIAEWDLEGSRLKRIRQPDYSRIILEFSSPGASSAVVLVIKPPNVRIHLLSGALPKALPRPPRFSAVIKSRLEGLKLERVFQYGCDRIVRFVFLADDGRLFLDAKLWGNAPNIILAREDGGTSVVIDAFSRRPGRGEAPGELWPPENIGKRGNAQGRQFSLRELPGEGSWNSRVENYYRRLEREQNSQAMYNLWERYLELRESYLVHKARSLSENVSRFSLQSGDALWGEICMANLHLVKKGDLFLEAEDWTTGGTVRIPLKANLTPAENARYYFNRQKRAARALERLKKDEQIVQDDLKDVRSLLQKLKDFALEAGDAKEGGSEEVGSKYDCAKDGGGSKGGFSEDGTKDGAKEGDFSKAGGSEGIARGKNAAEEHVAGASDSVRLLFSGPPPAEVSGRGWLNSGGASGSERSLSESGGKKYGLNLPGLWVFKPPYTIAVGRSAAESDTLLRKWAKGNDTWLHLRGRPGAHVFIRAPKGKSIPLEILLDAGNLALSCSQKNKLEESSMHYTQVKYLRRLKKGKTGAVIPTQEKNLHIKKDNVRLQALRELAGLQKE